MSLNNDNNPIKIAKRLRGEVTVPGDKSISHRSIMLGSISSGTTYVNGFLNSADCRSTISCFRNMGIDISLSKDEVEIHGKGLKGLSAPGTTLDVGNSGTTMRLISGILSGQNFSSTITGDASIRRRPMGRIITPLTQMGAKIKSKTDGLAPLYIDPSSLHGIDYTLPVASAQVKSCILFAGLFADSETSVTEIDKSRDHTERMLSAFGADINVNDNIILIKPGNVLTGTNVSVPGDISSAAYLIACGLVHNDADILIKNVNINPTRAGIISIVKEMGGNIELLNIHENTGELVCDIHVTSSSLRGCEISGSIIPTLIDELPVIALIASFAKGKTIIKDASELKNKESNRIKTVTDGLASIGAKVTPTDDGMIIDGGNSLHEGHIITMDDHRIAMTFSLLSLLIPGITLDNPGCVNISFENFYETINSICEY